MTRRWLIRCLCILLIPLSLVWWGRSCVFWDFLAFAGATRIESVGGTLYLTHWKGSYCWRYGHDIASPERMGLVGRGPGHLFGFACASYGDWGTKRLPERWSVGVPFWFLTLLAGVALPYVWQKTSKKKRGGAFPVELATRKEPS